MKLNPYSAVVLLIVPGAMAVSGLRACGYEREPVATAEASVGTDSARAANRTSGGRARAFDDGRTRLQKAWSALPRETVPDTHLRDEETEDALPESAATPELPPPGDQSPPDPATTLPIDQVLDYAMTGMRDVFPLIRQCYAAKSAPSAQPADNLSLRIVVEGDAKSGGVVTNSEVQGLSAQDTELATCVSDSVYAAKFDAPADGRALTVEVSFNPHHLPDE